MILAIETSIKQSFICLLTESGCYKKQLLPGGPQLSTTIDQALLFFMTKKMWAQIEAVAVSVGPGSYTGSRVGLTIAQAIVFAKNLPLIDFCSLETILTEDNELALLDAKSGGVYAMQLGAAPKRYSIEELQSFVAANDVTLVSPDPEPLQKKCSWLACQSKKPNFEKLATILNQRKYAQPDLYSHQPLYFGAPK